MNRKELADQLESLQKALDEGSYNPQALHTTSTKCEALLKDARSSLKEKLSNLFDYVQQEVDQYKESLLRQCDTLVDSELYQVEKTLDPSTTSEEAASVGLAQFKERAIFLHELHFSLSKPLMKSWCSQQLCTCNQVLGPTLHNFCEDLKKRQQQVQPILRDNKVEPGLANQAEVAPKEDDSFKAYQLNPRPVSKSLLVNPALKNPEASFATHEKAEKEVGHYLNPQDQRNFTIGDAGEENPFEEMLDLASEEQKKSGFDSIFNLAQENPGRDKGEEGFISQQSLGGEKKGTKPLLTMANQQGRKVIGSKREYSRSSEDNSFSFKRTKTTNGGFPRYGNITQERQRLEKVRDYLAQELVDKADQPFTASEMQECMIYLTKQGQYMMGVQFHVEDRARWFQNQVGVLTHLPVPLPGNQGCTSRGFAAFSVEHKFCPLPEQPGLDLAVAEKHPLYYSLGPDLKILIGERSVDCFKNRRDFAKEKCSLCLFKDELGFSRILVVGGWNPSNQSANDNYGLRAVLQPFGLAPQLEFSLLPQLNSPRIHCSSFVHRGYLFVAFGESIPESRSDLHQTKLNLSLEFTSVEGIADNRELPAFKELTMHKGTRQGSSDQKLESDERFLNACILPDKDSPDSFYIYGGLQQKRNAGTHPLFSLKIDFSPDDTPVGATLTRLDAFLPKAHCSFSQIQPQNKRFFEKLGAWVLLDEEGDLHGFKPCIKPVFELWKNDRDEP